MEYPYYKVKNEKEFKYIRTCLNSFEYITGTLIYCPGYDYIVLDFRGKFGFANNTSDLHINRFCRYEITNINEFLTIAAKLKGTTFNPNKTKTNMENNKPQTKEPKIGDVVLVKNTGDENYVQRIYLGTYKNKYITVGYNTSNNFKECCSFGATFWDEMITRVTLTKTQIANKFGISVDILDIVD